MLRLSLRLLLCFVVVMGMGACQLQRAAIGTPQNQAQWDVQPPFFCPGDAVTVSWDLSHLPRSTANCNPAGVTSCASSATCPGGPSANVCLDEICCSKSIYDISSQQCPVATGCYPAFSIGISSDDGSSVIAGETHQVTGSRSVTPSDTTTFTINGLYNPPPIIFDDSKVATMVHPAPATQTTLFFPFLCGSPPGWGVQDFNRHPLATEHAVIGSVRNNSGHTIIVRTDDPMRGPITLAPGESSAAFNGTIRGVWSAQIAPRELALLPIPRCEATHISDSWPNLSLQVMLQCVVP